MRIIRIGQAVALLALVAALNLPALDSEPTKVRVPEGTKIHFTLSNTLSTKDNRQGDDFSGVVSRPVRVGDRVVIPEGSQVRGLVTDIERAGRIKGRARITLRFDEIELPDGTILDLSASLTEIDSDEKETVSREGSVKGQGSKKRDAATVGVAAGIGAAIGAIAGGAKGTAIGAGSGAAAGAGLVLLTRGKDAELRRGTELAIQLNRALSVPLR